MPPVTDSEPWGIFNPCFYLHPCPHAPSKFSHITSHLPASTLLAQVLLPGNLASPQAGVLTSNVTILIVSLQVQPSIYMHNLFSNSYIYKCQRYPVLCNPMEGSLPDSPIHGILRQEYWSRLPLSSSRDLPCPGIEWASPTCVFFIGSWILYHCANWEA